MRRWRGVNNYYLNTLKAKKNCKFFFSVVKTIAFFSFRGKILEFVPLTLQVVIDKSYVFEVICSRCVVMNRWLSVK